MLQHRHTQFLYIIYIKIENRIMPIFTEAQVEKYLDDFFRSLPDNKQYQEREVGAVYFALLDDQFKEEIANPMSDVKELIEQAEEYINMRINGC